MVTLYMSDSCGILVARFLREYMLVSEVERGRTAEGEPLWEDIVEDGKRDFVPAKNLQKFTVDTR